jgi:hypothetical protein
MPGILATIKEKLASRKFWFTLATFSLAWIALFVGKLDGASCIDLIKFIAVTYVSSQGLVDATAAFRGK